MSIACTRCEGTGFINIDQCHEKIKVEFSENCDVEFILDWVKHNSEHDVSVCDCCGDTYNWHGVPGEHYNNDDPGGDIGPYAYNGGLCECN